MLKYYDFSGVSFLVDKRFKCEIASEIYENASARFDLVHNPTVPYLTDSKFTPFSAPSRGRLYRTQYFVVLNLEPGFTVQYLSLVWKNK